MTSSTLSALLLCTLVIGAYSIPVRVLQSRDSTDINVVVVRNPYEFGYQFGDGLGMVQHRQESSDGTGLVQGSYGYQDPLGVYRRVEYKAGSEGYSAIIKSNEPGLSNHISADATYVVEPPPASAFQNLISAKPGSLLLRKK